jgi:hypothetical protein
VHMGIGNERRVQQGWMSVRGGCETPTWLALHTCEQTCMQELVYRIPAPSVCCCQLSKAWCDSPALHAVVDDGAGGWGGLEVQHVGVGVLHSQQQQQQEEEKTLRRAQHQLSGTAGTCQHVLFDGNWWADELRKHHTGNKQCTWRSWIHQPPWYIATEHCVGSSTPCPV